MLIVVTTAIKGFILTLWDERKKRKAAEKGVLVDPREPVAPTRRARATRHF